MESSEKKSESQIGFEPTTLREYVLMNMFLFININNNNNNNNNNKIIIKLYWILRIINKNIFENYLQYNNNNNNDNSIPIPSPREKVANLSSFCE